MPTAITFTIDNIDQLVCYQDQTTADWHDSDITLPKDNWPAAVMCNHAENYQLWHQEDKARREDMGFEYIYHAKRAIDGHNQKRNNQMEIMDTLLFDHFQLDHQSTLPMHSETPGMMIDRLSIMSLKLYHMQLQADRQDASDEHRQTCQDKCTVLTLQRTDLKNCLSTLFDDLKNKRKTFRLYKQMKMYNDKTLNPQLYR